jgi:hypothetical protein
MLLSNNMYILNPDSISNFKCNSIVANYLLSKGVPILSRKKNIYYFAKSELTRKYLQVAPLHIKIFIKLAEIF